MSCWDGSSTFLCSCCPRFDRPCRLGGSAAGYSTQAISSNSCSSCCAYVHSLARSRGSILIGRGPSIVAGSCDLCSTKSNAVVAVSMQQVTTHTKPRQCINGRDEGPVDVLLGRTRSSSTRDLGHQLSWHQPVHKPEWCLADRSTWLDGRVSAADYHAANDAHALRIQLLSRSFWSDRENIAGQRSVTSVLTRHQLFSAWATVDATSATHRHCPRELST